MTTDSVSVLPIDSDSSFVITRLVSICRILRCVHTTDLPSTDFRSQRDSVVLDEVLDGNHVDRLQLPTDNLFYSSTLESDRLGHFLDSASPVALSVTDFLDSCGRTDLFTQVLDESNGFSLGPEAATR